MRVCIAVVAIVLFVSPLAAEQPPPCQLAPQLAPLPVIPELVRTDDGRLRGTIVARDEEQRIPFRDSSDGKPAKEGAKNAVPSCQYQFVRIFEGVGTITPSWVSSSATPPAAAAPPYPDPSPGPTLRARVGDVIELAFLNQIDAAHFIDSDRGDIDTTDAQARCDATSGGLYPGAIANGGDQYPNCFHGSTTVNLHFHGTHTNPSATGDNVFLEIRPSPRANGKPTVTEAAVKAPFDTFFHNCEVNLKADALKQWPATWADLPAKWTLQQTALLKQHDATPGIVKLWPTDQAQIRRGGWPQHYIGAFPYCFRLPEYSGSWPPAKGTHDHGRPLMMGQSPGTHWYHAHKHGSSALDVANGLTGAFIIEGEYDDELNDYYKAFAAGSTPWTRTQPVIVINQLGVGPNIVRGAGKRMAAGPDFAVNGRLNPTVRMRPGEIQMWRIVNAAGRSGVYFTGPPAGFTWRVLAQDGVQLNRANYNVSQNRPLLLPSGSRADFLVQAPATPNASPLLVQNEVDYGQRAASSNNLKFALMTIDVVDEPAVAGMTFPPATTYPRAYPAFLADITAREVTGAKNIVFGTTPNPPGNPPTTFTTHTIDGTQFNGEVGAVVLLNRVEEWKVSNATVAIAHPFHIHLNPFQVVEEFRPAEPLRDLGGVVVVDATTGKDIPKYVTDKAKLTNPGQCYLDPNEPESWKPCDRTAAVAYANPIWRDVYPIPAGLAATDAVGTAIVIPGYFRMRSRFVDFPGYYVIHCHMLAHEDRGMMTIVQVAPTASPYTHH